MLWEASFLYCYSGALSSLGSVIVESELIHMIILSCRSPVQGQLLLPFLLFIKSWQLSHNFTLRLMENLSVEFMVFFGRLLNWERSPAQSPECGKPFCSSFLILSGPGQWMNVSAFDLPHQSGGTNESQGTFEHKLNWVIFTGKGLRVSEALFEDLQGERCLIWSSVFLSVLASMFTLLCLQRFMSL